MKLHVEHIERTSLISKIRITRLNAINTTLLVRLYKIFTRTYMVYACTALTALNWKQRQKLKAIQNLCRQYARRAVGSTCIFNNELRSRCNIVSVEQHILTLAGSWWKKASKNSDDIINFTYHINQTTKQELLWISSKVTGSSNPFALLRFYSNIFYYFVAISFTIIETQILRQHYLLSPVILLEIEKTNKLMALQWEIQHLQPQQNFICRLLNILQYLRQYTLRKFGNDCWWRLFYY